MRERWLHAGPVAQGVTIKHVFDVHAHTYLPVPTQDDLRAGEEIARCPSCSLFITVIYNPVSYVQHL